MKNKLGVKTTERQNSLKESLALLNSDADSEHSLDVDYSHDVIDQNTKLIDIEEIGAAPDDWNVWSTISRVKQIEMMESIQRIGLQHNIVLWKVSNEFKNSSAYPKTYMTLSGHNRIAAYKELFEITNHHRYVRVRAFIHTDEIMTPEKLKKIIDDTNEIGRSISTKDRASAIKRRYIELSSVDRDSSEKSILSAIGDDENKEYRQIKRYYDLNRLIDPFLSMVGSTINIKSGVALSKFDSFTQEDIYNKVYSNDKYSSYFVNKHIVKLKKYMDINKIIAYFDEIANPMVTKYKKIEIPIELESQILTLIDTWKSKNKS